MTSRESGRPSAKHGHDRLPRSGAPETDRTALPHSAIEALPGICAAARAIHATPVEARTAALLAMTGLLGMVGWTAELVGMVEREMAR